MRIAELNFWNFLIKYIGEIETKFGNTSACLSGPHMGLNHLKMEDENLMTHSFKAFGYDCLAVLHQSVVLVSIFFWF